MESTSSAKSPKRRYLRTWLQEFSSKTTLHGIQYIGEGGAHFIERLCWVSVVVFCAIGCCSQIQSLWVRWNTSPVIVSFAERSTAISDIPFPALTICPESKVQKRRYNIREKIIKENKSIDEHITRQALSLLCYLQTEPQDEQKFALNTSHKAKLKRFAPKMDEIFMYCMWYYDVVNCSSLFRPVLTDEGVCYTFNMLDNNDLLRPSVDVHDDPFYESGATKSTWEPMSGYTTRRRNDSYPRRTMNIGVLVGLSVVLKTSNRDMQKECLGDAQSYKLLLHAPSEYPQVLNQHFRAPQDSMMGVSVRPNIETTAEGLRKRGYTPTNRGCYFPEERHLRYFKIYSQKNCEMECASQVILNECGCIPYYAPMYKNNTFPLCSAAETTTRCMLTAIENRRYHEEEVQIDYNIVQDSETSFCKCLPSCTEYKYHLEITNSPYNGSQFVELDTNVSEYRYNVVYVFFKDKTYLGTHRNELYGQLDFLANCGGLLGLFTGFSLISAIEIIYFLTLKLCWKRKDQVADLDDETEQSRTK